MAKLQRRTRRDRPGHTPTDTPTETFTDTPAPGAHDTADPADVDLLDPTDPTDPSDPADPTEAPRTPWHRLRAAVAASGPVLLLQAAHPRQAVLTGLGLGVVAVAADRPVREAAVVAATGLVGQAILGWHNDIVDRDTDARHRTPRKPVSDGRLDVGSAWYALVLAVLLVIPLSITTGVDAGTFFLAALAVGLLGNVVLRRGRLSWLSWAVQYALFAPYLALGGWGGTAVGDPPEVAMVVLFALLGVGVHVLRSLWGLVADDADGWTYLPLVLGRRLGAARLLLVAAAYTGVVLALMVVVGGTVGLRR
jgi:hypothetical protein